VFTNENAKKPYRQRINSWAEDARKPKTRSWVHDETLKTYRISGELFLFFISFLFFVLAAKTKVFDLAFWKCLSKPANLIINHHEEYSVESAVNTVYTACVRLASHDNCPAPPGEIARLTAYRFACSTLPAALCGACMSRNGCLRRRNTAIDVYSDGRTGATKTAEIARKTANAMYQR